MVKVPTNFDYAIETRHTTPRAARVEIARGFQRQWCAPRIVPCGHEPGHLLSQLIGDAFPVPDLGASGLLSVRTVVVLNLNETY